MEVILSRDVDKFGKSGQVVKVKDGFARNFLIPNGLAVAATPANLKVLEQLRQRETLQLEKVKKECLLLKEKLEGLSLTMPVLTHDDEALYASIGVQDIAEALKEEGIDLEKKSLLLEEPIKSLGIYEVEVKLHPEVDAKVKVWVVKK